MGKSKISLTGNVDNINNVLIRFLVYNEDIIYVDNLSLIIHNQ